ncbi:hypothetical protein, partial [Chromobacterium sp. ASV23]|uniref:hypothetical protein n=1 Tax=Chromobacterium sp. ASV23 TaxID=2795110 RepID=UPI0018EE0F63
MHKIDENSLQYSFNFLLPDVNVGSDASEPATSNVVTISDYIAKEKIPSTKPTSIDPNSPEVTLKLRRLAA